MSMTNPEVLGTLVVLLTLAWLVRGLMTRKFHFYWFMVWNMALATAPILPLSLLQSNEGQGVIVQGVLSVLWLLFLPNTYYLLTDFMHLNPSVLVNRRNNGVSPSVSYGRGDEWFLVDSLLLFLTTLFAAVVGGLALDGYYLFLKEQYLSIAGLVMGVVILFAAIGVYIGRFSRWNSWDAILRPHRVLRDFLNILRNRSEATRLSVFVGAAVVFELFSWMLVTNFRP